LELLPDFAADVGGAIGKRHPPHTRKPNVWAPAGLTWGCDLYGTDFKSLIWQLYGRRHNASEKPAAVLCATSGFRIDALRGKRRWKHAWVNRRSSDYSLVVWILCLSRFYRPLSRPSDNRFNHAHLAFLQR